MWLDNAKVANLNQPIIVCDTADCHRQITAIQILDKELDERLQLLSDLSVQCSQIDTVNASQIRPLITALNDELSKFRSDMSERVQSLKDQAREHEKSKKQADEVWQTSKDLQKWFDDMRKKTGDAQVLVAETSDADIKQAMEKELAHHRQLIEHLSVDLQQRLSAIGETNANWMRMRQHVDVPDANQLSLSDVQGLVPLFLFQYSPLAMDPAVLSRTRRCFVELNACWDQLLLQVEQVKFACSKCLIFHSTTVKHCQTWPGGLMICS
jgi:Sec-independent protein translocase protein TatA